MQLFYFVLKAGLQTIPDYEGQEFSGEDAARQHAVTVARQLMRNREHDTRRWRIQVCDDYLCPLFEVYFVKLDATFVSCSPDLRAAIEEMARTIVALNDAVTQIKSTLIDVRDTLIRAERMLAARPGARL